MCKPLSFIYTRGGRLLYLPEADSHERIIQVYGLDDTKPFPLANFVRLEFTVADWKYGYDPSKYDLIIDQGETPSWWDSNTFWRALDMCKEFLKEHTVTGKVEYLSWKGAPYILIDAEVELAVGRIIGAYKNSVVVGLDGPIEWTYGNTTIHYMYTEAYIDVAGENTKILTMTRSSAIGLLTDNATVERMTERASILNVAESARVGTMTEQARIRAVSGAAHIDELQPTAAIYYMEGNAVLDTLLEGASVTYVFENAAINRKPLSSTTGEK